VIDGYSVKDAANILGVKEGRVWELIARGVLASAPDGPDGMRVFLQPKPTPAQPVPDPYASSTDDPNLQRHNGNGGGTQEMSPFRELLTEFRNLTERYGQALLALGEARGEVAALRTRVELLEARMDLRLPSTRPASTVAWEIPGYATAPEAAPGDVAPEPDTVDAVSEVDLAAEGAAGEVTDLSGETLVVDDLEMVEPTVGAVYVVEMEEAEPQRPDLEPVELEPVEAANFEEAAESAAPDADTGPTEVQGEAIDDGTGMAEEVPESGDLPSAKERRAETRRRRIHGGRTALAGIAEALARADDPTLAELPGAEDAAQALAALRGEMEAARAAASVSEESPTVAAEEDAGLSADGGLSAVEGPAVTEPMAREAEVVEPMVTEAEAGEPIVTEEEAVEPMVTEAEVVEPTPVEPEARDTSPYSTEIVEPDWFADGDFTWLEAAQAEEAEAAAARLAVDEPATPTIEPSPSDVEAIAQPPHMEVGDAEAADAEAVAAELAPQAPQPFEPSAQAQAVAEEEARAAIQDAFEEPPTTTPDVSFQGEAMPAETLAIQDAFEEPATPLPAVDVEGEAAHEETVAIQDAFEEVEEPPTWVPPMAEVEQEPAAEPITAEAPEAQVESQAEPPAMQAEVPVLGEAAPVDVATPPEEFIAPAAEDSATTPSAAWPEADRPTDAVDHGGEEELMWLGDEFEEASLEIASQGWRGSEPAPQSSESAPVLELSDAELSQLAEDEGWDMDEVEAIRSLLGRPTPTGQEPGSPGPPAEEPPGDRPPADSPPAVEASVPVESEPDVAIADEGSPLSNEAAPIAEAEAAPIAEAESADAESADANSVEAEAEPSMVDATSADPVPQAPRPSSSVPRISMSPGDPQWLKGRRGPAATAYRRLRRLFPS
jgi:hypothetical protein